jgi:3-oxoacyl-[acyl-carrier-protein] synthase II
MAPSIRVSGVGVVSPFGTTHDAFVTALLAGQSAIAPIEDFDTTDCRTTIAARTSRFDPTAWVAPMRLRRLDRTGVYAVAATRLAFEDGGRAPTPEGDDGAGVVLGTWSAGGQSSEQYLAAFFGSGPAAAPALLFESTVANAAASLAGMEFKLRGPNATVSHKEASGLAAIVAAVDLLRADRVADLVAGGVDGVYEVFFKGHDRFRVMSAEPAFSRRLAPFDADRAGFVLGEGGYGLWLTADRLGDCRHGEIIGTAAAGAAVPVNAWPDNPDSLARTMALAIEDAGLTAADVDVVYASANATRTLDAVEAAALRRLFGGSRTVVTSVKGALGESGLSGAAACAAAFLCGRVGRVPPIAGIETPDPATAGLTLATTDMAAPGPVVLVNSFASGGALFSVVLRVAEPA